jgi:uncharacterized membrane protein YraQ (UPF0718 family)
VEVEKVQEFVANFTLNFTSIVYEALPFVVLGVVLAGILEEFVPQQLLSGVFKGQLPSSMKNTLLGRLLQPLVSLLKIRLIAIMFGGLLGLVFPMCECGIIPIMRRLIRKGVPLSVCICYLLCGPIINVVVLLSTFVAFNYPQEQDYILGGPYYVMLLRAGMAFVIGCITSSIVEWQYQRHGSSLLRPKLIVTADDASAEAAKQPKTFFQRLGNISETSLHDFVDIMAFLILGATLAALGKQGMEELQLDDLFKNHPAFSILVMMIIALVFSLCSEADAFVAANFPLFYPPAGKLAFLVLGPMMDIKLYLMYTQIFRHRLIWTIIISVFIQVFLYSFALHYLWEYHGYSEAFWKSLP